MPCPGRWPSSQKARVPSQQLAVPFSRPQGKGRCSSLLGLGAKLDENEWGSRRHLVALSTLLCAQALCAGGCCFPSVYRAGQLLGPHLLQGAVEETEMKHWALGRAQLWGVQGFTLQAPP